MFGGNRKPSASEMTKNLKVYGNGSMAKGIERLYTDSRQQGLKQGFGQGYVKGQQDLLQKMDLFDFVKAKRHKR